MQSAFGDQFAEFEYQQGPPIFEADKFRFTHILVVVDYFSRFIWAFPTTGTSSDKVIRCLAWLFHIFTVPIAGYSDNQPFGSKAIKSFFTKKGSMWIPAPVEAHRAVGLAEKMVDLTQRVIKKDGRPWPLIVQSSSREINKRDITHLGYSPFEILLGFQPTGSLDLLFPSSSQLDLVANLRDFVSVDEESVEAEAMLNHVADQCLRRQTVIERDDWEKRVRNERYNLGIFSIQTFSPGNLVMLYDEKVAKRKLHPAYRGPFKVTGFSGNNNRSYSLSQLDRSKIKNGFHGDQLKLFRPREGYLIPEFEHELEAYQNIRAKGRKPNFQNQLVEQATHLPCPWILSYLSGWWTINEGEVGYPETHLLLRNGSSVYPITYCALDL
ncbi:hypothetical protein K3495_g5475 [Podosphaera aphanis]|nr:hypothetical protein K3495_g5475 [Podosphaera aphanis]